MQIKRVAEISGDSFCIGFCGLFLLERILAETVAGDGKAAHVVGARTAEVLIDIDLGQVLP